MINRIKFYWRLLLEVPALLALGSRKFLWGFGGESNQVAWDCVPGFKQEYLAIVQRIFKEERVTEEWLSESLHKGTSN